jgi:hypothetical protein
VSQRARQLMAAMAQVATGQDYDTLIEASSNLLLNGLRQKHGKLEDAEDHLDRIHSELRIILARDIYDHNGYRRDNKIIIPTKPLEELVKN